LCVDEHVLKLLVANFQSLDLESLSLSGGLGGTTIPENTFNTSLLFLVIRLGSFSGR